MNTKSYKLLSEAFLLEDTSVTIKQLMKIVADKSENNLTSVEENILNKKNDIENKIESTDIGKEILQVSDSLKGLDSKLKKNKDSVRKLIATYLVLKNKRSRNRSIKDELDNFKTEMIKRSLHYDDLEFNSGLVFFIVGWFIAGWFSFGMWLGKFIFLIAIYLIMHSIIAKS